ncbi:hypothetical protein IFM89_011005 [Coptis chinensis]|uniref:J domain-containing protein required for chloroplast accumulation response 1 n=1 Tax=Coptis chinensis TaxID=261450 RepID=A0A835IJT4_9MAGN|nr:hypothetical protein IFM89_011005 [Coptis chinensis]
MESFSSRENVLLGYIPRRRTSLNSLKTSSSRNSNSEEVDFHDVFGGPPRRSSIQDLRRRRRSSSSPGEYTDSNEEETAMYSFRDPWSGLNEKPVFGEENLSRRKYPSDDFFDDIFRGDESSSSKDPFSSTPGSRISSPSRSRSLHSESFRASLLPPMLSLPVKMPREMDSPAFLAQSRSLRKSKETAPPGSPTSRFSAQVFQGQESLKNDSLSSYRQSSLSKGFSLSSEESAQASKSQSEDQCKVDSNSPQVTYNSNQFHFSIYKWASKGVPANVLQPLREVNKLSPTENSKTGNRVFEYAASVSVSVELLSGNDNMLAENESLQGIQENHDDNLVLNAKTDLRDSSEIGEEVIPVKPETRSRTNLQNIFKKVQGNLLPQISGKEIKSGSGASGVEKGSLGGAKKRMPASKKEESKLEEPLYCLLNDTRPGWGDSEKRMPISKKEEPEPEEPLYSLLKDIKHASCVSGADIGSFGGSEEKIPVLKKEATKDEEPLYCLIKDIKPVSGTSGADHGSVGGTEKVVPNSRSQVSECGEPLYCLLKETNHDSGTETRMSSAEKISAKPEEPLYCLLKDDSKRHANGKAADKARTRKGIVNSTQTSAGDEVGKKVEKETGKQNISNLAKATTSISQHSPVNSVEKLGSKEFKGKVKEFEKIINQEAPSKPLDKVETHDQDCSITDIGAARVEDQASVCAAKDDQKNRTVTDAPFRVDQSLKRSAKRQPVIKTVDDVINFSLGRNGNPPSCSDVENFEVNLKESHYEDLNCTVKELSQDQNKVPQAAQNQEELQVLQAVECFLHRDASTSCQFDRLLIHSMQASDAKIRKWSNGKEGNIRSLLSTLQYVLWPESGWKPVPLVEIIEGNSVRRAYQKALLCLHPDKLQQKGAAPHQKYIAEKVFDILQNRCLAATIRILSCFSPFLFRTMAPES